MRPMMPPPAGIRGPMHIGGGPRGYLTEKEKENRPKVTKKALAEDTKLLKAIQMAVHSGICSNISVGNTGTIPLYHYRKDC